MSTNNPRTDPNIHALVESLTPHLSMFYSHESIIKLAQQVARGEQPKVGDQTLSLHMGEQNIINNATIHMGNRTINVYLPNPENIGRDTAHAQLKIKLNALLENHESSAIFRNRLVSFVGRKQELADIRQRIAETQSSGGYVTITGQAGEGKSSVIAQLVAQASPSLCPFHFIPLVPGREYQLSLLSHLTARLIIKYDLPIEYFPNESYSLMRNLFGLVLRQLQMREIQETIYIDGLDQLERDYNKQRDLSFLPEEPPAGIVFVLGTRPDDTLQPLELLKPHNEYRLPPLSFADFEQLLAIKRPVVTSIAERLYNAVHGNALYLSLISNELIKAPYNSIEDLLALISADPNNIFKITLSRIERHDQAFWDAVTYPLLALLLVTQEPLHHHTLGALLNVNDHKIRRAVHELGGLVAQDSAGRSFLYHLTIRDYLQENSSLPNGNHIFARHEIIDWHRRLAHWCMSDLDHIWDDIYGLEQTRRIYARHHTITHLALGQEYSTLWQLIDDGSYGQHKRQYDPSTRLYAHDLDRARDIALQTKDILHLWRTSLLRVSLTSTIDKWPNKLFIAYTQLGQAAEMLQRIELLSQRKRQIILLCKIWPFLEDEPTQAAQAAHVQLQSTLDMFWVEANTSDDDLVEIVAALVEAELFDQAQATAKRIKNIEKCSGVLIEIAINLIQAGRRDDAEYLFEFEQTMLEGLENDRKRQISLVIFLVIQALVKGEFEAAQAAATQIKQAWKRTNVLLQIAMVQAHAGHLDAAQASIATAQAAATQIKHPWERANALTKIATVQAQTGHIEAAQATATQIKDAVRRADALVEIATVQAQTRHIEAAQASIAIAQEAAAQIEDVGWRANALTKIATVQAQTGHIDAAQATAAHIEHAGWHANALMKIVTAQAQTGHIDAAQATTAQIKDVGWRANALVEIATAQAQAGYIEAAQATAAQIAYAGLHANALVEIATVQAQTGHIDAAQASIATVRTMVAQIEDAALRADALIRIATVQVHAGQIDTAQANIATAQVKTTQIKHPLRRANALVEIATVQAQTGQIASVQASLATAQTAATQIKDAALRVDAFMKIATVQVQTGQIAAAQVSLATAQTAATQIKHPWQCTNALVNIATAQAQTGHIEAAHATAIQIKDAVLRVHTFVAIAIAQAQIGYIEAAQASIATARAMTAQIKDAALRANALVEIVKIQAQTGHIAAAYTTTAQINNEGLHANALVEIATAQAQVGQIDAAQATAAQIGNTWRRAYAFVAIATAQVHAGQIAAAQASITTAQATAAQIKDAGLRVHTFVAIATTQAQIGHIEAAQANIATAQTAMTQIEDALRRANALVEIATVQVQTGQIAAAQATATQIEDALRRANALVKIATVQVQAGQIAPAQESIAMAQAAATQIDHAPSRANALVEIILAKAKVGKVESTPVDILNLPVEKLAELINIYIEQNQHHIAQACVFKFWHAARTRNVLIDRLSIITPLIVTNQPLIQGLIDSFAWVDDQL